MVQDNFMNEVGLEPDIQSGMPWGRMVKGIQGINSTWALKQTLPIPLLECLLYSGPLFIWIFHLLYQKFKLLWGRDPVLNTWESSTLPDPQQKVNKH